MAKDSVRLPQSTAGIGSYNDVSTSMFIVPPGHVVAFIVVVAILVILLKVFGPGILGI